MKAWLRSRKIKVALAVAVIGAFGAIAKGVIKRQFSNDNDRQSQTVKNSPGSVNVQAGRDATVQVITPSDPKPRRADLLAAFDKLETKQRGPGIFQAIVHLTLRNPTDFPATNVHFRFQHRPGTWTGYVDSPERYTIPAKALGVSLSLSADTVADPAATLKRGDRLYFALRADWDNPDLMPACKMFFVEYFEAPGAEVGQRAIIGGVRTTAPESVTGSLSIPDCEQ